MTSDLPHNYATCAFRCAKAKRCFTMGGEHHVYKCKNKQSDHFDHYFGEKHRICVHLVKKKE